MRTDRVINIRFLFCIFVGLIFGILVGKLFLFDFKFIFVLILALGCVLFIMLSSIFYSKHLRALGNVSPARENLPFIIMCSGIGVLVAFVVGVISCIMPMMKICNMPQFYNDVVVTGQVQDAPDVYDNYVKFYIGDAVIVCGEEVIKSKFDIEVYSNSYTDVSVGDYITFNSKLDSLSIKNDFEKLARNVGYTTYVNTNDIVVTSGAGEIRDSIQSSVYNVLNARMSEDNAQICFAIIFGEKSGLSQEITDAFSYAGISHILAVSGLHVSVLVMILWFFLKRLRINKYAKLIFFSSFIIFYMYLCSFSPSVSRAGIMAIMLVFCKLFRFEYDALSSLSLAGIIILLISPLTLFSISFQLSFMCLFSIISLVPTITKLLLKIKIPKALAQALAVSITLSLAILPICTNVFSKVSLLGVISNIFVIPIFTATYILLFCCVLISLIIPVLGGALIVPEMLLHIIKVIAGGVSSITFGVFKVFAWGYWVVLLLIVFAILLHYLMTKHYMKSIVMSVLLIITCTLCGIYSLPINYNNNTIVIAKQYNTNICIVRSNDKNIMIGSNISKNDLLYLMKELKINSIDMLVAYDLQLNSLNNLKDIVEEFDIEKVCVPSFGFKYLTEDHLNALEIMDEVYESNNMVLETVICKTDIVALKILINSSEILIVSPENSKTENKYLLDNFSLLDGWICVEDAKIDKESSVVNFIFVSENDNIVLHY